MKNGDRKKSNLSLIPTIVLFLLTVGYLLFSLLRATGLPELPDLSGFRTWNTAFISILMQAFPFMLIGVLLSSLMHIFMPDGAVVRLFPMKRGLGFFAALFAGLVFPVCECAIVPVTTRLVKKGVPLPIAVTFMMAAPIINPVVIVSTLYAFPGMPQITLMRVGFGLLIALVIGLLLLFAGVPDELREAPEHEHEHGESCGCCDCEDAGHRYGGHNHSHNRFRLFLTHAGDEFFSVGKYLVLGACITSLIQSFVPREAFTQIGGHGALSLLVMMLAAFLFSACSTSDAFIARGFADRLPMGAVLGFLVYGPMMDMKNLLMLFGGFKKGFVLRLAALITLCNFILLVLLTGLFL